MKRVLLLMATYLTLMGCSQRGVERPQYMMDGAWVLRQAVHPDGSVVTYDTASTICRIYGGRQCVLSVSISSDNIGNSDSSRTDVQCDGC
ncbi:MAG: hypothetical protein IKH43_06180 [Bacteroidaceae bacterium]|nr:hypothetical protein [Bacteroidaceae bacterium]